MFHKVKKVEPLDNYKILVTFEDGTTKVYDVNILFDKFVIFNQLKLVQGLFEQVKVDTGGYGIYWNDDIDLSCNELWDNGI